MSLLAREGSRGCLLFLAESVVHVGADSSNHLRKFHHVARQNPRCNGVSPMTEVRTLVAIFFCGVQR